MKQLPWHQNAIYTSGKKKTPYICTELILHIITFEVKSVEGSLVFHGKRDNSFVIVIMLLKKAIL